MIGEVPIFMQDVMDEERMTMSTWLTLMKDDVEVGEVHVRARWRNAGNQLNQNEGEARKEGVKTPLNLSIGVLRARDLAPNSNCFVRLNLKTEVQRLNGPSTWRSEKQATKSAHGSKPVWDKNFCFSAVNPEALCEVEVIDSGDYGEQLVGTFTLELKDLMLGVTMNKYLEILDDNVNDPEYLGELLLKVNCDVPLTTVVPIELDVLKLYGIFPTVSKYMDIAVRCLGKKQASRGVYEVVRAAKFAKAQELKLSMRMQRSASFIQEKWRSRGVWQRVFTIIRRLKNGQVFMKYAKSGSPKSRLVWMDGEMTKIFCSTPGYQSESDNKFIPVKEVLDILTGRGTEECFCFPKLTVS